MLKKCVTCKIEKNLELFSKGGFDRRNRPRIESACKQCLQKYHRSEVAIRNALYTKIQSRIKTDTSYINRNLCISRPVFNLLLDKLNFSQHYQVWVSHNFAMKYRPTIDRIDNQGDYTLGNIQLLPFGENSSKDKRGDKNHFAKATIDQVLAIRTLWDAGIKRKELASMFSLSETQCYRIGARISWSTL